LGQSDGDGACLLLVSFLLRDIFDSTDWGKGLQSIMSYYILLGQQMVINSELLLHQFFESQIIILYPHIE
jgi:hypothetical protein